MTQPVRISLFQDFSNTFPGKNNAKVMTPALPTMALISANQEHIDQSLRKLETAEETQRREIMESAAGMDAFEPISPVKEKTTFSMDDFAFDEEELAVYVQSVQLKKGELEEKQA